MSPVLLQEMIAGITEAMEEVWGARIAALEQHIKTLTLQKGERGETGPPGPEGLQGPRGEPGADGRQGEPGRQGDPGEKGVPGPEGPAGSVGRDGRDGTPGPVGPHGEKGLDGRDGLPGRDGKDGVNGRDGTLEQMEVKALGHRTIQFVRKDTGDSLGVVTLPIPVFRDVFKADTEYEPGDLVRWGGTVYIAKAPGSGIVPGDKSPMSAVMWDVFSERGRQGKTGDVGKMGERGPQGEKGERGPERW